MGKSMHAMGGGYSNRTCAKDGGSSFSHFGAQVLIE